MPEDASSSHPLPFSYFLYGAGVVGTAVARLLSDAGCTASGVSSRTPASATRAAELVGAPVVDLDGAPLPDCDVVLLGVTEAAFDEAVAALRSQPLDGRVVWHFAGAVGREPLRELEESGARTIALHPVQSCPSIDAAYRRLPGCAWGVTSPSDLNEWAHRVVVEMLGGIATGVPEEGRAVWHAAAATVSNGASALLAAGEEMLAGIGISAPERVLAPLAAGTAANAGEGGGGAATLTGPVARGNAAIVAAHLRALAREDVRSDYAAAAALVLRRARKDGRIDPQRAAAIERLLEGRS